MTPLRISAFGSAARPAQRDRRTVLGVKGALRRGTNRRALDPSAPFCRPSLHDGRLDATRFLRLNKTRTDGSRQTS
jgi:hypothetical protein